MKATTPAQLFAAARADVRRVAYHRMRVGDYLDDLEDMMHHAERVWSDAVDSAVQSALTPARDTRDFLFDSGRQLQQFAQQAWSAGATTAAQALDQLSGRLANAIASIGGSWSQVVHQLMGGSPMDFAELGALFLVLVGAGLFLTPGGTAIGTTLVHTGGKTVQALGPSIARALMVL